MTVESLEALSPASPAPAAPARPAAPAAAPDAQAPEAMTEAELEHYRLHRRFDRLGRLVGDEKMKRLMSSHVLVVGLGGVGSWAAEMIVRSGVGAVTLVDFDEICVTNFNRQLHCLQGLVGTHKADVLAERFRKINPQAAITPVVKFYNKHTSEEIFARRPDFVIDAIDHVTSKCFLLNHCRSEGIPLVSSTGSGGRLDPTRVQVKDLTDSQTDPLARSIRKILRQKYDFPEKGPWGIPAVYSDEVPTAPVELRYDGGKGFRCVCPQGENEFFNCDNRNLIMGNAGFVTGAFGMACASVAVRRLIEG